MGLFSRNQDKKPSQPGQRRLRATSANDRSIITPSGLPSNSVFLNPNYSPAESLPYSALRPLTAAAVQVQLNDRGEAERFRSRRTSTSSSWQTDAWEYYDAIGEIKYAFNLVASVVSRIRLYAAIVENPAETPMPVRIAGNVPADLATAAERALQRLDSAYGGQAGLLRDAALNLAVTGECYLVQSPAKAGSKIAESWDIRSVDELSVDSKGNYLIAGRREYNQGQSAMGSTNRNIIKLPPNAFVGRIWRAHPRFSDEADSSLKGLLSGH